MGRHFISPSSPSMCKVRSLVLSLQGNIEIREDLDEAELERWRRDRREKVRAAKLSEKQEQEG